MRAFGFVLAGALAIACAPPRDRGVRLARLAAERRSLDATLENLEARLAASQARVRFWQEIRARHESVSAVTCASLDEHADEMAKRAPPPPPRSSLHHARVAAATTTRPPARAPAPAASKPARAGN